MGTNCFCAGLGHEVEKLDSDRFLFGFFSFAGRVLGRHHVFLLVFLLSNSPLTFLYRLKLVERLRFLRDARGLEIPGHGSPNAPGKPAWSMFFS